MEWKWLKGLLPANEFHLNATQQQKMAQPEKAPNSQPQWLWSQIA